MHNERNFTEASSDISDPNSERCLRSCSAAVFPCAFPELIQARPTTLPHSLSYTQSLPQTSNMRVIALVSLALALALAASSMPLSTRADGGVSTAKGESTGTLSAVGSGLDNVVNPPGSGTSSAGGLENVSLGSSTTSGSENGGGAYKSGSGTASGSAPGSINPTRRSTTSSTPASVEGAVSQLGGEASTVGGTTSTSNLIPVHVIRDLSAGVHNLIVRHTLRSRAVVGSAPGGVGVAKATRAFNHVEGTSKNRAAHAAGVKHRLLGGLSGVFHGSLSGPG